jgi:predicted permease
MDRALEGSDEWLTRRNSHPLSVMARRKPGVPLEKARAEVDAISRRLALAYPDTNQSIRATLLPVWKAPSSAPAILGPLVQILLGVSGVVLLIVCANVANLLLARATARHREFAIRLGLGASRARLIRQLLTESLLLSLVGAGAGVLLAFWMSPALAALAPATRFPLFLPSRLDARVLGFTILLALLAGVLFGLAPALETAKADLHAALKEGGRGATSGLRSQRLRKLLVVAQVALALVSVIGAGLFAKSFQNARHSHPGFEPQGVMLAALNLSSSGYERDQGIAFCRQLRLRLEALPGVQAVTYADRVPLGFEGGSWQDIQVEGYLPRPGDDMKIYRNKVAPDYFRLMKIPLVQGRDFSERDDEKALPVAIVNEAFVRRFLPGPHPLGRHLRGWDRTLTIVGVAGDSKYRRVDESPLPYLYVPFLQFYRAYNQIFVHIRTAGAPEGVLPALRREVRALDPNVAVFGEISLADYTAASLVSHKVAATVMSVLGALALLLAALGLYSLMAYSVSRRTHEIGVREALGAQPRDVLRLVVGQGLALSLAGVAAGLAAALALTRLAASLLFSVSPTDPLIFTAAALFLAVVALAASYIPARRATRVDPAVALRHE